MNSCRRLLALLIIPFSLLNTPDIQSMSILNNKTACVVGGVGLCGMVATYVLTKKYSNKKLIDEKAILVEKNNLLQKDTDLNSREVTALQAERAQLQQEILQEENLGLIVKQASDRNIKSLQEELQQERKKIVDMECRWSTSIDNAPEGSLLHSLKKEEYEKMSKEKPSEQFGISSISLGNLLILRASKNSVMSTSKDDPRIQYKNVDGHLKIKKTAIIKIL
jgi:hypothetical protein